MRKFLSLALLGLLAACAATNPTVKSVPSNKSTVELPAVQTSLVPRISYDVMRGVIATLHDLGYRIARVESDTGTVSATRQTALRIAVVVQPRSQQEAVVRANATIVAMLREGQVNSPSSTRRTSSTRSVPRWQEPWRRCRMTYPPPSRCVPPLN